MPYHTPVLLKEVLKIIEPRRSCAYVDATCGSGGYSRAIMEMCDGDCVMICNDWDMNALKITRERMREYGKKVLYYNLNFAELPSVLRHDSISEKCNVASVVLDLGLSQMHLDSAERGFSFRKDGPLDMRMDLSKEETAYDLLARLGERELAKIFRDFGEEPRATRVAREICSFKKRGKLEDSTVWLADLVSRAYRSPRGRIHPATRVFQALRIAVNNELENLKNALCRYIEWMRPGTKLIIVSYHSLEDRLVKHFIRANKNRVGVITRKPVTPSEEEIMQNKRARSAKLRAIVKK